MPVGCHLATGRVSKCDVTLVSISGGKRVIVGHGGAVFGGAAARGEVSVDVTLTAAGRALARRIGGLNATARSSIHAVGSTTTFHREATTRIVLPQLLVLSGDLLFDTDSSVVKPAALRYIEKLKVQVAGARGMVCDGFTDTQGSADHNLSLGHDRAVAVCALFAHGTSEYTRNVTFGETQPRASNDSAEGRALNRRVEIHVSY